MSTSYCRPSLLRYLLTPALIAAVACWTSVPALGTPKDRIGEKLQDVTLTTLDGKKVQLLDYHKGDVLVIAYTGLGCPISGRYAPRLEKLAKDNKSRDVHFVGINANPHNSPEEIAKEVKELGIAFPMLKDHDQELTRQLDAHTTTEVFVVDKDNVIRYRGMVDDQYALGAQRKTPKNKYLKLAIKDVRKGRQPFVPRTAAPGCLITRVVQPEPSKDVTYASHVARIMQDNCQQCHRQDQVGPFPLTTYEHVRGWSAMIHSVVKEGRMPPWNAHSDFDGRFVNQRKLDPKDKQALLTWIQDGMPRGNPDDEPPAKEWPDGWRIGEPDEVFRMRRAFSVPADGVVDYQYFRIPTDYKEDRWIRSMEAKAGAEDVVHHILTFIVEGELSGADLRNLGLRDGFLCATVPGDTPSIFPPGAAKKLPAGASIWLQVHYTTNGKKRRDRCSLGVIFADEPVEHEVKTLGVYNLTFEIPPHAENHEVRAEYTLEADTDVLSLYPHMHFRGKDWTFFAHLPDGKTETLLAVPTYDYNWQESYILNEPIRLPKGTRLECVAHFDNSAKNFVNPDPSVAVRFGEQSWDEMMIGYLDYIAY